MDIINDPYQGQREYGGFGLRFVAYLIDTVIIGIPLGIISLFFLSIFLGSSGVLENVINDPMSEIQLTDAEAAEFIVSYFFTLLMITFFNICVTVVYFAGCHSSKWQATVGKRIVGLIVTDLNGNRISFWRATGRYFSMSFLSGIFFIGYLMVLFTEKKQSLHDLIVSTIVVKNK